jgi:hypothetical protein
MISAPTPVPSPLPQGSPALVDRGLLWCYGYNHDEAVRCFKKAAKHDPKCAMVHWGIAYAAGPNYNKQWVAFDPLT